MESVRLKEELHEFIELGDDKLLKLMYALAKEYTEVKDDYELSKEEIREIDKRRERYLSGQCKGYAWNEARKIIIGQGHIDGI